MLMAVNFYPLPKKKKKKHTLLNLQKDIQRQQCDQNRRRRLNHSFGDLMSLRILQVQFAIFIFFCYEAKETKSSW